MSARRRDRPETGSAAPCYSTVTGRNHHASFVPQPAERVTGQTGRDADANVDFMSPFEEREKATDPYNLKRFVDAQDSGGTYQQAVGELRRGRKTTHWMWFVFPQLAGLGQSAMSRRYAIASLDEARAYLRHPVLGPRLVECASILAATAGRSAEEILGPIDTTKLRSSMTLFLRADPGQSGFAEVLERYFDGAADPATDERLGRPSP